MSQSFWSSLSSYCAELAPVAGPLLSAVGETAHAIERAGTQTRSLPTRSRTLRHELVLTDDDE